MQKVCTNFDGSKEKLQKGKNALTRSLRVKAN